MIPQYLVLNLNLLSHGSLSSCALLTRLLIPSPILYDTTSIGVEGGRSSEERLRSYTRGPKGVWENESRSDTIEMTQGTARRSNTRGQQGSWESESRKGGLGE